MEANKINLRNLSPELKALILAKELDYDALVALLSEYRRKNEVIAEGDIAGEFKQGIYDSIAAVRRQLDEHVAKKIVIGEEDLTLELAARINNFETQLEQLFSKGTATQNDILDINSRIDELNLDLSALGLDLIRNDITALSGKIVKTDATLDDVKKQSNKNKTDIEAITQKLDIALGKENSVTRDSLDPELLSMVLHGEDAFLNQKNINVTAEAGDLLTIGKDGAIRKHSLLVPIGVMRTSDDIINIEDNELFLCLVNSTIYPDGLYIKVIKQNENGESILELQKADFDTEETVGLKNCILVDKNTHKIIGAMIDGRLATIEPFKFTVKVPAYDTLYVDKEQFGNIPYASLKVFVHDKENNEWIEAAPYVSHSFSKDGTQLNLCNPNSEDYDVMVMGV